MLILVCTSPTLLVVSAFYHTHPTPTHIYPNCLTLNFCGPIALVLLMLACSLCCCIWLPYCMQLTSTVPAAPTYPALPSHLHVLLVIPPYCTGWLVLLCLALTLAWACLGASVFSVVFCSIGLTSCLKSNLSIAPAV